MRRMSGDGETWGDPIGDRPDDAGGNGTGRPAGGAAGRPGGTRPGNHAERDRAEQDRAGEAHAGDIHAGGAHANGAGAGVIAPAERVGRARDFVARIAAAVGELGASLDEDAFDRSVQLLSRAHRIVVTGVGKSGLIGAKIAATFSSTGSPAHFLHATEAAHGDLGIVGREDVVLAISNSGSSTELTAIVEYCRRFTVPMIGVTSCLDSTLGRRSNVVLLLPKLPEGGPLPSAPMTSTTLTLVLGDALASALIEDKGFDVDDFHNFHPGGRLGVQTMRLSRLIERETPPGERDPFTVVDVPEDADIDTIVDALGRGPRGIVGVRGMRGDERGRIIGSITDGDLRRALARIRSGEVARARDLMHRDPVQLPETALVADALATCEERRIAAVFVADGGGRVRAVVTVKDLLAAGAA